MVACTQYTLQVNEVQPHILAVSVWFGSLWVQKKPKGLNRIDKIGYAYT